MPTVGIVIDLDAGHYRVSLRKDVDGAFTEVAWSTFTNPLPLPAGDDDTTGVDDRLRTALSESPDVETVRGLGQHLWSVLFDDVIGPAWRQLAPSRTILDIRAPDLEQLAWEALQDGLKIMFAAPQAFTRGRIDASPIPLVDLPLRVLVVVGELDDERLDWRSELCVLEVLGAQQPDRFHVEVIKAPPQLAVLQESIQELRPHVLHFIAHGSFVDGSPMLTIGKRPQAWNLNADVVVNDLQEYPIPLVVLNACHTADPKALQGSYGLGAKFRENGSIATISMQGAIHSTAAADFSRAFYTRLVAGDDLDVACIAGRRAIAAAGHEGVDRWLPQLVLGAQPGPLVTAPQGPASPDPLGAIDRTVERRKLLFALAPSGPGPSRRAAIVHGDINVGKTWVARSAGHLLRSMGANVRYVDMTASKLLDWQAVLRAIRDPATGGPPTTHLPAELFWTFNAGMEAVAGGNPPPDEVRLRAVDDAGPIRAEAERTLEHIGVLFEMFRKALAAAAVDRPLILVLDHIEWVAPDALSSFIVPRLLQPIAMGEVDNVSVMVVARAAALDSLQELRKLALDVAVAMPDGEEFPRFAAVYRAVKCSIDNISGDKLILYDTAATSAIKVPWPFSSLELMYSASIGGRR